MKMKNMYPNNIFETYDRYNFNNLHTDYKAEVVALNLLNLYNDIDHVYLKRVGINNRTFKKDINAIQTQLLGLEDNTITIETARESIYDYLPEGVFHTPTLGLVYDNIEHVIIEIQKQKEIENNARKFFEPFELESYFAEIKALNVENQFEILDDSNLLVDIISELWPILQDLDTVTASVFIYLLPFMYSVKGSKTWLEKCLQSLLEIPVQISLVPNVIKNTELIFNSQLVPEQKLGISTMLVGDHMDGLKNWKLTIGPIPYNVLDQYVPGAGKRKLLEKLYDFFIPLNIEIIEEFITVKTDESFIIEPLNTNKSILGFSTFI